MIQSHCLSSAAFLLGQAGIEHLAAKLENVDLDNIKTTAGVVMSNKTVVDVLYHCETVLIEMLTRLKLETSKSKSSSLTKEGMLASLAKNFDDGEFVSSRPFNTRIALPSDGGDAFAASAAGMMAGVIGSEEAFIVGPDEEMTREQMKQESLSIQKSHTNKVKRPKKKKKRMEEEAMRRKTTTHAGGGSSSSRPPRA